MIDGTPYIGATSEKKSTRLDTLTGDEFKTLIEQFTKDGKINTIPELMRALSDIPEDQTLGEYIREHGVDPEALEQAVDDAIEEKCVMTDADRVTPEELAEFEV